MLVAFIFWVATMGDKGKAAGYGGEAKGKLPRGVPAMAGGSSALDEPRARKF
jgi:hypothetical protein